MQENPVPVKKYPARLWTAIAITSVICIFLIWLDTHVLGHYTDGLFLLTPLFSGFCSVLLYGEKNIPRGRVEGISLLTLLIIFLGLLALQIDWLIGRAIIDRRRNTKIAVILIRKIALN